MSRTFIRIVVFSSLLVFITLIIFSTTTFTRFEGIVTQRVYDENIKELRIISDNVKNMHEIVKNFTFQQIDSPSLSPLFLESNISYAQMYEYMDSLSKSIRINPVFHSVSLYSGITGKYYSTLSSKANLDKFFTNAIENYTGIQALTPIPRKLPEEVYYTSKPVFTYFYFQTDKENKVINAMAVNLDAAWLCDNLRRLKGNSDVYIVDKKNGCYIDEKSNIRDINSLNPDILEKISQPDYTEGSFEIKEPSSKNIVTYLLMKDPDWVLVVDEPDTFMRQSVQTIRKAVIQITLGIALLAFVVVLIISRTIYNPFGKLFKQVVGQNEHEDDNRAKLRDELKLISEAFKINKEKLNDYNYYKNTADNILLENYIKAVLLENNSMSNQLTGEFYSVFGNVLENGMMLILLKIDNLVQFEKLDTDTKKAYRFSIMNACEEVLDVGNSANAVFIGEGKFIVVAFLNDTANQEKKDMQWNEKIVFIQDKIKEFTDIGLTAAIGGYAHGAESLIQTYNTACSILDYGVIHSQKILDVSVLESHTNIHVEYDEKLEEKILDFVRTGQIDEAKIFFDKFVDMYSQGDIEGFMLSVTRFSLALWKTIEVLNKSRVEKISVSMKEFYGKIASFESIEELKCWFYQFMEKVVADTKVNSETRHNTLVESVKGYIAENYSMDLSLKGISTEFKISQGYLGTIFKEIVGMSVMDFINNVKLERAEELLTQTELSIGAIMERTGFFSESNFFRLFKKKYGVTPKTFRMDRQIIEQNKR